jgi:hypothetical protein
MEVVVVPVAVGKAVREVVTVAVLEIVVEVVVGAAASLSHETVSCSSIL